MSSAGVHFMSAPSSANAGHKHAPSFPIRSNAIFDTNVINKHISWFIGI